MKTKNNNYDAVSWFYDSLSRFIFGKAIVNAQVFLLRSVPKNSEILIVGGGTGWILDEIAKIHPAGLTIIYIEISSKMIALAQKRNFAGNRVIFIEDSIEDFHSDKVFDVIITPFLFDNFSKSTIQKVYHILDKYLKSSGLWLFADFQNTNKRWQKTLLYLMYMIFRKLCKVEALSLTDMNEYFMEKNYKVLKQNMFYCNFITSKVYQKPAHQRL